MYLREEKSHCSSTENTYGWTSWKFEYKLDYSRKKGYCKPVKITAYIQKDRVEQWSEEYEQRLTISRSIQIVPNSKSKETHNKLLSEGYF